MRSNGINVGIDLGTTNSVCYVFKTSEGIPELQKFDKEGRGIYPSVVYYNKQEQDFIVGETVKENDDWYSDAFAFMKVKMAKADEYQETNNGKTLSPIEFSSIVLKYMLNGLKEKYENLVIDNLVITVPAYFKDFERKATLKAAKEAGFNVTNEIRLINEPTAAALAYGEELSDGKTIVTYDLGGGTFDVTLLEADVVDGVNFFEAIKTDGKEIGGKDFDQKITEFLLSTYHKANNDSTLDEVEQVIFAKKVRNISEDIKISLSKINDVNSLQIIKVNDNRLILEYSLTREEFNNMIKPLIDETVEMTKKVISSRDVDYLVLVGGSTRIPLVEERLKQELPNIKIVKTDPDMVVAKGACIQSAIMSGAKKSILNEILTSNIGVSVVGNFVEYMIKANSPIPFESTERFFTNRDGQSKVESYIVQGKDINLESKDNSILGKINMNNLKVTDTQTAIDVKIRIDNSGMIEITASEVAEEGAKYHNIFNSNDTIDSINQKYEDLVTAAKEHFSDVNNSKIVELAEELLDKLEENKVKSESVDWLIDKIDQGIEYNDFDLLKEVLFRTLLVVGA